MMVIDRYEIGERQTSACGIPTGWLEAMGLGESLAQTFGELVIHTPHTTVRYDLPWTFSTFDYRTLCGLLADQGSFSFETAKVSGRSGSVVQTDRGEIRAGRWSSTRSAGAGCWRQARTSSLPTPCSPGLEVHPFGSGRDLEVWIDRSYVPAGYGWSFPAGGELRIGVGSFDPRFHVREPTVRLAEDLGADTVRYQGNWIPHALRDGTEDGVFFVGDSAGHCLPLTAEGIRTALYFGLACGRELRAVVSGDQTREQALARYHAFSASHAFHFRWLLRDSAARPRVAPRVLAGGLRAMQAKRFIDWSFGHYLDIAHPDFVGSAAPALAAVAAA